MANTTLTLQSSNEELKADFEAVCKIVDSNSDEFPINLDEVRPLAYAEKGAAVCALKNGFIEDVDYKTIDSLAKRGIMIFGHNIDGFFMGRPPRNRQSS